MGKTHWSIRALSLTLAICLLLGIVPPGTFTLPVFAAGTDSTVATTSANVNTVKTYAQNLLTSNYDQAGSEDSAVSTDKFSWDTEGNKKTNWRYYTGVMLDAFVMLGVDAPDKGNALEFAKSFMDTNVDPNGNITYYIPDEVDSVPPALMLLYLLDSVLVDDDRRADYETAANWVYDQIMDQTPYAQCGGNLLHKQDSNGNPSSGWEDWNIALDGLYMAQVFLMEYANALAAGKITNTDADPAEIYAQVYERFMWVADYMYDSATGLYHHAWDVTRSKGNGVFWGRAIGWYAVALVEIIDRMPEGPYKTGLIAKLPKLFDGMLQYQDSATGMWYNIVDQKSGISDSNDNQLETSVTSLMSYALMKAYNEGWVTANTSGRNYGQQGLYAFNGLVSNKYVNGAFIDTYQKSGAGDTLAFYCANTYVANEAKGIGAILMAASQANQTAAKLNATTAPAETFVGVISAPYAVVSESNSVYSLVDENAVTVTVVGDQGTLLTLSGDHESLSYVCTTPSGDAGTSEVTVYYNGVEIGKFNAISPAWTSGTFVIGETQYKADLWVPRTKVYLEEGGTLEWNANINIFQQNANGGWDWEDNVGTTWLGKKYSAEFNVTSDNESVVKYEGGNLVAKGVGVATVTVNVVSVSDSNGTYTVSGATDTIEVIVTDPTAAVSYSVADVVVTPGKIEAGQSGRAVAYARASDGTDGYTYTYTYSLSGVDGAWIDTNGVISTTAGNTGTATVTATLTQVDEVWQQNQTSVSTQVEIVAAAQTPAVTYAVKDEDGNALANVTLKNGQTFTPFFTVMQGGTDVTGIYTMSLSTADTSGAIAISGTTITAKKVESDTTVTVTATFAQGAAASIADDNTVTFDVVVTAESGELDFGLSDSNNTKTVQVSDVVGLEVEKDSSLEEDASLNAQGPWTWTSSNPDVATVVNHGYYATVVGLSQGRTIITATNGNTQSTGSVTVTVNANDSLGESTKTFYLDTDGIDQDAEYIIVWSNGSQSYALYKPDTMPYGVPIGAPVTISGNTLTIDGYYETGVLWTFAAGSGTYSDYDPYIIKNTKRNDTHTLRSQSSKILDKNKESPATVYGKYIAAGAYEISLEANAGKMLSYDSNTGSWQRSSSGTVYLYKAEKTAVDTSWSVDCSGGFRVNTSPKYTITDNAASWSFTATSNAETIDIWDSALLVVDLGDTEAVIRMDNWGWYGAGSLPYAVEQTGTWPGDDPWKSSLQTGQTVTVTTQRVGDNIVLGVNINGMTRTYILPMDDTSAEPTIAFSGENCTLSNLNISPDNPVDISNAAAAAATKKDETSTSGDYEITATMFPDVLVMSSGETANAYVLPSLTNGKSVDNYTVSYSIADNTVATVDSSGKVTAGSCGQTTLTATVTLTKVDGNEIGTDSQPQVSVSIPVIVENSTGTLKIPTSFQIATEMEDGKQYLITQAAETRTAYWDGTSWLKCQVTDGTLGKTIGKSYAPTYQDVGKVFTLWTWKQSGEEENTGYFYVEYNGVKWYLVNGSDNRMTVTQNEAEADEFTVTIQQSDGEVTSSKVAFTYTDDDEEKVGTFKVEDEGGISYGGSDRDKAFMFTPTAFTSYELTLSAEDVSTRLSAEDAVASVSLTCGSQDALDGYTVSYQVLDETIAAIDENGNITPEGAGTTKVVVTLQTVTVDGKTTRPADAIVTTFDLTVEGGYTVTIDSPTDGAVLNMGLAYTATATLGNSQDTYMKWWSSDEAVLKIDQSTGEITLVGSGTATITASVYRKDTNDWINANDTVDVTVAAPTIGIDDTVLVNGQTGGKLTPTVKFQNENVADLTGYTLEYQVTNGSSVTVDGSGNLTTVGKGASTVTVYVKNTAGAVVASDTAIVEVIYITSAELNENSFSLYEGESLDEQTLQDLVLTIHWSDGPAETVTCSSEGVTLGTVNTSNPGIYTVPITYTKYDESVTVNVQVEVKEMPDGEFWVPIQNEAYERVDSVNTDTEYVFGINIGYSDYGIVVDGKYTLGDNYSTGDYNRVSVLDEANWIQSMHSGEEGLYYDANRVVQTWKLEATTVNGKAGYYMYYEDREQVKHYLYYRTELIYILTEAEWDNLDANGKKNTNKLAFCVNVIGKTELGDTKFSVENLNWWDTSGKNDGSRSNQYLSLTTTYLGSKMATGGRAIMIYGKSYRTVTTYADLEGTKRFDYINGEVTTQDVLAQVQDAYNVFLADYVDENGVATNETHLPWSSDRISYQWVNSSGAVVAEFDPDVVDEYSLYVLVDGQIINQDHAIHVHIHENIDHWSLSPTEITVPLNGEIDLDVFELYAHDSKEHVLVTRKGAQIEFDFAGATDAQGKKTAVDTSDAGAVYTVPVMYQGQQIYDKNKNALTITVKVSSDPYEGRVDADMDDYPGYPAEGSVKFDKNVSTDGTFYNQTGVAQLELTAAGVTTSGAVDVILIVDISNSMAWTDDWFNMSSYGGTLPQAFLNYRNAYLKNDPLKSEAEAWIDWVGGESFTYDGVTYQGATSDDLNGKTNMSDYGCVLPDRFRTYETQYKAYYEETENLSKTEAQAWVAWTSGEIIWRNTDEDEKDEKYWAADADKISVGINNVPNPGTKLDQAMESASAFAEILLDGNVENSLSFVTFAGMDHQHYNANKTPGNIDSVHTVFTGVTSADAAKTAFGGTQFDSLVVDGESVSYYLTLKDENGDVVASGLNRGNTNYDYAFGQAYEAVIALKAQMAAKYGKDTYEETGRQLHVVFMTDGAPSHYNGVVYNTNQSHDDYEWGTTTGYTTSTRDHGSDIDDSTWLNDYISSYNTLATKLVEEGGLDGFHAVGFDMAHGGFSEHVWQKDDLLGVISGLIRNQVVNVEDATSGEELIAYYTELAQALTYSGTDAQVTDIIGSDFTLYTGTENEETQYGETVKQPPSDMWIKSYRLVTMADVGQTLRLEGEEEDITLTADNIESYLGKRVMKLDGQTYVYDCEELEHVTFTTNGETTTYTATNCRTGELKTGNFTKSNVNEITGHFFRYVKDANGKETITWNLGDITDREIALSYYVYLKGSMDGSMNRPGGTYDTNKIATLEYVDNQGRHAARDYKIPNLPWQEASVTVRFFLVNEKGEYVNFAGTAFDSESLRVFLAEYYVYSGLELSGVDNFTSQQAYADAKVTKYPLYDSEVSMTVYRNPSSGGNAFGSGYTVVNQSGKKNSQELIKFVDTYGDGSYVKTVIEIPVVLTEDLGESLQRLEPVMVVVDYGKPIDIDVISDQEATYYETGFRAQDIKDKEYYWYQMEIIGFATYSELHDQKDYVREDSISDTLVTEYGQYTLVKDEHAGFQVRFTPSRFFEEPENVFVGVKFAKYECTYDAQTDKWIKGAETSDYFCMYKQLSVVPATVMYYETDFADNAFILHQGGQIQGMKYTANLMYTPAEWYWSSGVTATITGPGTYTMTWEPGKQINDCYVFYIEIPGAGQAMKDYRISNMTVTADDKNWPVEISNVLFEAGADVRITVRNPYIPQNALTGEQVFEQKLTVTFTLVENQTETDAQAEGASDWTKTTDPETDRMENPGETKFDHIQNEGPKGAGAQGTEPQYAYGYDSTYSEDNYLSDGSSWFINGTSKASQIVAGSPDTYATFTFQGTGFDLISRTGKDQATLRVHVYQGTEISGDPYKIISVIDKGANELYQIPVISVKDMPHGTYTVQIIVYESFNAANLPEELREQMARGNEFYFDAIRIYDPVKPETVITKDANGADITVGKVYSEDGENEPVIIQIGELLMDLKDFEELGQGALGTGAVYMDAHTLADGEWVSTDMVQQYQDYGPNNEVYLNPGQGIAFILNISDTIPASLQIGAKSIEGNAPTMKVEVSGVEANDNQLNASLTQTVTTSTAMYYKAAYGTGLADLFGNNKQVYVFIWNDSTDASQPILSITDIKIGYASEAPIVPVSIGSSHQLVESAAGVIVEGSKKLVRKNGEWCYCDGDTVLTSYTGLVTTAGAGTWYVNSGKVDFTYNGMYEDTEESKLYYIRGGMVDATLDGIASRNGQWMYFTNGVVDTTFTGIVTYGSTGQWYVENGIVRMDFSGTVTVDNTTYTIQNGKVVS